VSTLVLGGASLIVTWAGLMLVILLFIRYAKSDDRSGRHFVATWFLTSVTAVLTITVTIVGIQLLGLSK